jgi:hypothetical protein
MAEVNEAFRLLDEAAEAAQLTGVKLVAYFDARRRLYTMISRLLATVKTC